MDGWREGGRESKMDGRTEGGREGGREAHGKEKRGGKVGDAREKSTKGGEERRFIEVQRREGQEKKER